MLADHGLTASIELPPADGPPIPVLTAVVHDAAASANAIAEFVEQLDSPIKVVRQKVSGRIVSRLALPGTAGVELSWWAEGKHLIVTMGAGAVEAAIAIADGKKPNFMGTAHGKKLAAKPDFERTGLVWFDATALRKRYGTIRSPDGHKTVDDIVVAVGLDSLKHVLVQSGYKDRSLWTTIDIDAPGPRKGLMGLLDPKNSTMTLKDLPPLPVSNTGFTAQRFSLVALYDTILDVSRNVAKLGPPNLSEQLEGLLGQLPELIGCDLREDLLVPLGSVQCLFSDSNQGLIWADQGLLLQVSDAARLRATTEKLLARVRNELPEEVLSVVHRNKHGQDLMTLRMANGAFNPSFMIGDKWMCIGLSSQTVESFALRLNGELPSWKPDAATAEALATVPPKFASISVADPRHSIRTLVAATPLLLGIAQAGITQASRWGQVPPFDLTATTLDLPPAELVVRPLFPNVCWSVVDESGIHLTSRRSAPSIPVLSGVDGGTIAVAAIMGALLMPAVGSARAAAQSSQSMNNLRQIALAMHNFESANRSLPPGTIPSKKLKPEERQSWMVELLPYLGEDQLYQRMNVNLQESALWNDDRFKNENQTVVSIYVNPAQASKGFEPGEAAVSDYAGWAGVGKDAPTEKCKPEKKGIFGYDRATRTTEITDGMSNTIMVSEVVGKGRGPWAQGGTATIRALTSQPYVNGADGIGGPRAGRFIAAFADGSVRFISNNVAAEILEGLATRAGGEVLGDF